MPKRQSGKINRHFAMDRWFDILEGEPPRMVDAPILHHYTDAFGVQGIVSSNSLWATATQFSNDLSEIEYSVSIAVELVEETWGNKKRKKWFVAVNRRGWRLTAICTFRRGAHERYCDDQSDFRSR